MICNKIIAAAAKKGYECECKAYGTSEVGKAIEGSAVLLIGPQVAFQKEKLQQQYGCARRGHQHDGLRYDERRESVQRSCCKIRLVKEAAAMSEKKSFVEKLAVARAETRISPCIP